MKSLVSILSNLTKYATLRKMDRKTYKINLKVNGRKITEVIIDPHYEVNHSSSINDEIIIALVKALNGNRFPVLETNGDFEYFVTDQIKLQGKLYKLIWLLEKNKLYIGVVNAYRRKK